MLTSDFLSTMAATNSCVSVANGDETAVEAPPIAIRRTALAVEAIRSRDRPDAVA